MKGMIGFLIVGTLVVVGLGWWYSIGMSKPAALTIPLAIGAAKGETVEMNAPVGMVMTRVDPPVEKPNGVCETWDEWIDAHFALRDESKNAVHISRTNFSKVIEAHRVGNLEFYLVTKLMPGVKYMLDYMPFRAAAGEIHCYEFTPPREGQEFARVMLDLVD